MAGPRRPVESATHLAPNGRRLSPMSRLISLILMLPLTISVLAWPSATHAVQPRERLTAPGYPIPYADGSPGSWLGAYAVGARQAYCVDPHRVGSSQAAAEGHRVVARQFRDDRGRLVPARDLQRAAWILSTAGATDDRVSAAAVDTAVAALLGRGSYALGARRSEVRLHATGHATAIRSRAVSLLRSSSLYAGPLRVAVHAAPTVLGGTTVVAVRVTTATGRGVPGLAVSVEAPLDASAPVVATTDRGGRIHLPVTPTSAGHGQVRATVLEAPTTWPVLMAPDSRRFQRMALAGLTHEVPAGATLTVDKATPRFATTIDTTTAKVGQPLHDTVTVVGVLPGHPLTFTWTLLGPYRGDCATAPVAATGTITVSADGTVTTPDVPTTAAGSYTFVESSPSTDSYHPTVTACGLAEETAVVTRWAPTATTRASVQRAFVGAPLRDRVTITGVPDGTAVHVTAYLIGPARTEGSLDCTRRLRSVDLTVSGSGTWTTPPLAATQPGWYSWVEVLDATSATDRVATSCHDALETTLVTRVPVPVVSIDSGPDRPTWRTTSGPTPRASNAPVWARLRIAPVGIDVAAFATAPVGTSLPLPTAVDRVAWDNDTARPTDAIGRLLLGGHVGTRAGGRGPFAALDRVRQGMRVTLTRGGRTQVFEVVSRRYYPRSQPLPPSVFNDDGPLSLALVTCTHRVTRADGSWHYVDNLVVLARRLA